MPSHQPYKRIKPQKWEEQKARIRKLFVDQDEKLENVVRMLKEYDGFDIGERQLKRKMKEWGFNKNIPRRQMRKMVRARRRRQDELARPTTFMRRQGNEEYQSIPEEKLDRFQRRFGLCESSSKSQSSAMHSNILCYTPSSSNHKRYSDNLAPPSNIDQRTREFNDSIEHVVSQPEHNELGSKSSPSSSLVRCTCVEYFNRSMNVKEINMDNSAMKFISDGKYREAEKIYELINSVESKMYGSHSCEAVVAEFKAILMRKANKTGCPQTILARFTDELTRFLVRERQKYTQIIPQGGNLAYLHEKMAYLIVSARWASRLVMRQRTLQIWEPILGPRHSIIETIRSEMLWMTAPQTTYPAAIRHWVRIKSSEASFVESILLEGNLSPQVDSVNSLLSLSDGSPDVSLEKSLPIERADIFSFQTQQKVNLLRLGRSKSLFGMYYSFLWRFEEAEHAFLESNQHMEYEINVEIKLYRLLWYAEHKTRMRKTEQVRPILDRAHRVFMTSEVLSEDVITDFTDRFKLLVEAVRRGVSIDQLTAEHSDDIASERLQSASPVAVPPASILLQLQAAPTPESTSTLGAALYRLLPHQLVAQHERLNLAGGSCSVDDTRASSGAREMLRS